MEIELDRPSIKKYDSWDGLGAAFICVATISLFIGFVAVTERCKNMIMMQE
jgi:hypothetical protein